MSAGFTLAGDLPPFDEAVGCPKCVGGTVLVVYQPVSVAGFPCCEPFGREVTGGHLCRVCGRCGYGWCEAPVDVTPVGRPGLRAVTTEGGDDRD